jgi:hypothetical protein
VFVLEDDKETVRPSLFNSRLTSKMALSKITASFGGRSLKSSIGVFSLIFLGSNLMRLQNNDYYHM